ncbi:hypothetical protein PTSG_01906 [Salpingoeca rosetta]|uniref:Fibronectin type-III domain-containing protein n=1 Tax=Salpingoeca rosetta (strain ATCC 50818 / BSB-021) TaxID=946362 RepID=F2TZA7_SALR5|nr:uncharacterized protein PTSG_01906 [Salpingoeca rosetta]EGD78931.1 hypothetical protein PTSG_01906 [Salpingoeca rosetta]|eukprot:XP_004997887.1 hypothetical protein PTSG_01906 [Salpingoeca rosetta]
MLQRVGVVALCAIVLATAQTGVQAAPTPTTSSPCTPSSCIIEWQTNGDGVTQYQLMLQDDSGTFQGVGSPSTDSFIRIDPLMSLAGCTNLTARIEITLNSDSEQGNVTIIPVEATGPPPSPEPPVVSVLSSDRINVSFSLTGLQSTSHWVHTYALTLKKRDSTGAGMTVTFTPSYPPAADSIAYAHVFTSLEENTMYDASVRAVSCAGTATSAIVSRRTSKKIVIDGNANDVVYVYAKFNITDERSVLTVRGFDFDIFYAALSVTLETQLPAGASLPRSALGTVSLTSVEKTHLVLHTQINTTEEYRDAVLSALPTITTPPCLSSFTQKLSDFSSEYSHFCVVLASSSASSEDLTATEPPSSTSSSSEDWKMPVIIAGAALGGVLLIGVAVYLVVQIVRNHRQEKQERESRVDLGLELSHATLY